MYVCVRCIEWQCISLCSYDCVLSGIVKYNSIHNVIYFRIALKTTVQRHISVSFGERSTIPHSIGKNEKRLREYFTRVTLKWKLRKYGDHDSTQ